jgi:hypothetical protein
MHLLVNHNFGRDCYDEIGIDWWKLPLNLNKVQLFLLLVNNAGAYVVT